MAYKMSQKRGTIIIALDLHLISRTLISLLLEGRGEKNPQLCQNVRVRQICAVQSLRCGVGGYSYNTPCTLPIK